MNSVDIGGAPSYIDLPDNICPESPDVAIDFGK